MEIKSISNKNFVCEAKIEDDLLYVNLYKERTIDDENKICKSLTIKKDEGFYFHLYDIGTEYSKCASALFKRYKNFSFRNYILEIGENHTLKDSENIDLFLTGRMLHELFNNEKLSSFEEKTSLLKLIEKNKTKNFFSNGGRYNILILYNSYLF